MSADKRISFDIPGGYVAIELEGQFIGTALFSHGRCQGEINQKFKTPEKAQKRFDRLHKDLQSVKIQREQV